jgi:hypothetical protein
VNLVASVGAGVDFKMLGRFSWRLAALVQACGWDLVCDGMCVVLEWVGYHC